MRTGLTDVISLRNLVSCPGQPVLLGENLDRAAVRNAKGANALMLLSSYKMHGYRFVRSRRNTRRSNVAAIENNEKNTNRKS